MPCHIPHFGSVDCLDRNLAFAHLETGGKREEEGELRVSFFFKSYFCVAMRSRGQQKKVKKETPPLSLSLKKKEGGKEPPSTPRASPLQRLSPQSRVRHELAPHAVGLHDLDALLRRARRGCTSAFFFFFRGRRERRRKSFDRRRRFQIHRLRRRRLS